MVRRCTCLMHMHLYSCCIHCCKDKYTCTVMYNMYTDICIRIYANKQVWSLYICLISISYQCTCSMWDNWFHLHVNTAEWCLTLGCLQVKMRCQWYHHMTAAGNECNLSYAATVCLIYIYNIYIAVWDASYNAIKCNNQNDICIHIKVRQCLETVCKYDSFISSTTHSEGQLLVC